MKYISIFVLLSVTHLAQAEVITSALTPATISCAIFNKQTVKVQSNLTLPKNCILQDTRFVFENVQNVSLNLNGATLQSSKLVDAIRFSTTNPAKPTRNVTIKNGTIKGYGTALVVHRLLTNAELQNLRANPVGFYPIIQRTATQQVTIDNINFDHPYGTAVFVYVGNGSITLKNSRITGARGPAIYLDTGSNNNRIINNTITKSGFLDPDGGVKFGRSQREAIAVDGSYNNSISNNVLADNARGGVHLYSNCGEKYHTDPDYVPRIFDAQKNIITNNTIQNNGLGGAVEVGKRVDWNLESWDCAKPVYARFFTFKYYWDNSGYNTIKSNRGNGVINIRTDNNTIIDNMQRVDIGSSVRDLKGDPLRNNVLQ